MGIGKAHRDLQQCSDQNLLHCTQLEEQSAAVRLLAITQGDVAPDFFDKQSPPVPQLLSSNSDRQKVTSTLCKTLTAITMTPDAAGMREWLKRESVRAKIKDTKGFDDAKYDQWAASLTLSEFVAMRQPVISQAKEMLASAHNLESKDYETTDMATNAQLLIHYSNIAFYSGIGITIVGFLLWYFLVQRYQDATVRAELKRLSASHTTNTANQLPQAPAASSTTQKPHSARRR